MYGAPLHHEDVPWPDEAVGAYNEFAMSRILREEKVKRRAEFAMRTPIKTITDYYDGVYDFSGTDARIFLLRSALLGEHKVRVSIFHPDVYNKISPNFIKLKCFEDAYIFGEALLPSRKVEGTTPPNITTVEVEYKVVHLLRYSDEEFKFREGLLNRNTETIVLRAVDANPWNFVDNALEFIKDNCPNLKHLSIYSSVKFDLEELSAIVPRLSSLTISLAAVHNFTSSEIANKLLQTPNQLELLRVVGALQQEPNFISRALEKSPKLRMISTEIPHFSKDTARAIAAHSCLQYIHVSGYGDEAKEESAEIARIVCSRPTFKGMWLATNQHMHLRKALPKEKVFYERRPAKNVKAIPEDATQLEEQQESERELTFRLTPSGEERTVPAHLVADWSIIQETVSADATGIIPIDTAVPVFDAAIGLLAGTRTRANDMLATRLMRLADLVNSKSLTILAARALATSWGPMTSWELAKRLKVTRIR